MSGRDPDTNLKRYFDAGYPKFRGLVYEDFHTGVLSTSAASELIVAHEMGMTWSEFEREICEKREELKAAMNAKADKEAASSSGEESKQGADAEEDGESSEDGSNSFVVNKELLRALENSKTAPSSPKCSCRGPLAVRALHLNCERPASAFDMTEHSRNTVFSEMERKFLEKE